MQHRTRDRLSTFLDVAPWVASVVALVAAVATVATVVIGQGLTSAATATSQATPKTVAISDDVLDRAGTFDPYPPGAALPEGFAVPGDESVTVDQAASASRAVRVAVLGDSLTVGATPGLQAFLGDVNLRIDAKVGRPMTGGPASAVVTRAGQADIVVVALGSNDSCDVEECTRRVGKILDAVNPDAILLWIQPARFRPNMDNVRQAVATRVAQRPRSVVLDWQPFQDDHPEIMVADRIHLTPQGYRLRAQVTADRVHSFIAPG